MAEDQGNGAERSCAGLSVSARLTRKFGLGDCPRKRALLFARLEAIADAHGDVILELISECVCCSAGKRFPGRYFARAICLKLAERKLYASKGENDGDW